MKKILILFIMTMQQLQSAEGGSSSDIVLTGPVGRSLAVFHDDDALSTGFVPTFRKFSEFYGERYGSVADSSSMRFGIFNKNMNISGRFGCQYGSQSSFGPKIAGGFFPVTVFFTIYNHNNEMVRDERIQITSMQEFSDLRGELTNNERAEGLLGRWIDDILSKREEGGADSIE